MRALLKLLIFTGLLIIVIYSLNRAVPAQHLPWRALNPAAPLGFATKAQLLSLSLSPSKRCIDMAGNLTLLVSIEKEPHRPHKHAEKKVCGWDVARQVSQSAGLNLEPQSAIMQCPLSIGTYLWTREINKIAMEELGQPVIAITHFGTYACRRQNGNNSGRWSEHAFANAWDVSGFKLSDGEFISVKSDWPNPNNTGKDQSTAKGRFLWRARKAACKIFNVTLSPDYNAAHHDHFHLDMGPNKACY